MNEICLIDAFSPLGWEATADAKGQIYYVNHIDKTTTWDRPPPAPRLTRKTTPQGVASGARQRDRSNTFSGTIDSRPFDMSPTGGRYSGAGSKHGWSINELTGSARGPHTTFPARPSLSPSTDSMTASPALPPYGSRQGSRGVETTKGIGRSSVSLPPEHRSRNERDSRMEKVKHGTERDTRRPRLPPAYHEIRPLSHTTYGASAARGAQGAPSPTQEASTVSASGGLNLFGLYVRGQAILPAEHDGQNRVDVHHGPVDSTVL